jgi:hypothetical protein
MGNLQTKGEDMFVLMCRGDLEVCTIGVFSNIENAIKKVKTMGTERELWIEKFRINQPSFYDDERDYIVWKLF